MAKKAIKYTKNELIEYKKELIAISTLSKLFSTSSTPMIYYRATENIYCKAFNAKNVSRTDCTADAHRDGVGVGIKTFTRNFSFQKIAEFDKEMPTLSHLDKEQKILKIADSRNKRINTTKAMYGLQKMIYHCVLRNPKGQIDIFEEPMNEIRVNKIRFLEEKPSAFVFTDGLEEYEFSFAKSTLYKRFNLQNPLLTFKVTILRNPMDALSKLVDFLNEQNKTFSVDLPDSSLPSAVIHLYALKKGKPYVYPKSGLNIWNAGGRKRDPNEVYIPYPVSEAKKNRGFFPSRHEKPWDCEMPDGTILKMRLNSGDADGKAIASDPNSAFGKWILRDVLQMPEGHVVTYEDLISSGIDSVVFTKHENGKYSCALIQDD